MAKITAEVIPDPSGARHYVVIFKHENHIIGTYPVRTEEEGLAQIKEALLGLQEKAEEEGYL
jgi:hypothetical protein